MSVFYGSVQCFNVAGVNFDDFCIINAVSSEYIYKLTGAGQLPVLTDRFPIMLR